MICSRSLRISKRVSSPRELTGFRSFSCLNEVPCLERLQTSKRRAVEIGCASSYLASFGELISSSGYVRGIGLLGQAREKHEPCGTDVGVRENGQVLLAAFRVPELPDSASATRCCAARHQPSKASHAPVRNEIDLSFVAET
jgi:hypothetical protein